MQKIFQYWTNEMPSASLIKKTIFWMPQTCSVLFSIKLSILRTDWNFRAEVAILAWNWKSTNLSFFICLRCKVVYMCSSLLQLAPGSRDLSLAEKRITVSKTILIVICEFAKIYITFILYSAWEKSLIQEPIENTCRPPKTSMVLEEEINFPHSDGNWSSN